MDPYAYKVGEACRGIAVGRTTLYKLINAGELVSYKEGASTRITRASIEDYIARRVAEAGK